MKYTTLALAGIIASAAALALLAGFATTQSPLNSFFATGEAAAVKEPIDVISQLKSITPAAGAQGKAPLGYIGIMAHNDVNITKLKVTIAYAAQLRPYFKYLMIKLATLKNDDSTVLEEKAILSLWKPSAVIILDGDDFNMDRNSDGVKDANITVTAYYEAKEGMLFDSLPVELNIQVLSTS